MILKVYNCTVNNQFAALLCEKHYTPFTVQTPFGSLGAAPAGRTGSP